MGCWGRGNFENDDALDWLGELQEGAGIGAIERVLNTRLNGAYIETPEAYETLAASEVVAALLGRPSNNLPVDVARWVAENRGHNAAPFREHALHNVRAILSGNSELRDLWKENEADFPFWKAALESLIARLESAGH